MKGKTISVLIILGVIIASKVSFALEDLKSKSLKDLSLKELQAIEKTLKTEAEQLREEIKSIKESLKYRSEIQERKKEKSETLTPGTPEHDAPIMKSQIERLQRKIETLKERETLILARIQLVDNEKRIKKQTEFLKKKQLPCLSINLGVIGKEKENAGTNTDYSYSGAVGLNMRIPINWWAIGPFIEVSENFHAGLEVFIPVVEPNLTEDLVAGLWVTGGLTHSDKGTSIFIGLDIEDLKPIKWRIFGKGWSKSSVLTLQAGFGVCF